MFGRSRSAALEAEPAIRATKQLFALVAATAIALSLPGSTLAAKPQPILGSSYAYPGKLVDGPEQQALLMELAVEESAGDIAAAVVTHNVSPRIAADEEWRAFYGANWQSQARARLEAADNAMAQQFEIDIRTDLASYANWDSSDGAKKVCDFIGEFQNEITVSTKDIVTGFMKNVTTGSAGCAQGNHFLVLYQSSTADWKVTQHEASHLFGATDVGLGNNFHNDDVMEDIYNHPDYWCSSQGWYHHKVMATNAGKYD